MVMVTAGTGMEASHSRRGCTVVIKCETSRVAADAKLAGSEPDQARSAAIVMKNRVHLGVSAKLQTSAS